MLPGLCPGTTGLLFAGRYPAGRLRSRSGCCGRCIWHGPLTSFGPPGRWPACLPAGADAAQAGVHRDPGRGGDHAGAGQLQARLRLRPRRRLLQARLGLGTCAGCGRRAARAFLLHSMHGRSASNGGVPHRNQYATLHVARPRPTRCCLLRFPARPAGPAARPRPAAWRAARWPRASTLTGTTGAAWSCLGCLTSTLCHASSGVWGGCTGGGLRGVEWLRRLG